MKKCFILISLTLLGCVSSARIIYVDDDAFGLNDGSSWENAFIYLQDALADARSSLAARNSELEISSDGIEIRVAKGLYTPDKGNNVTVGDYNASFELIDGVTLSGGYAGILESDPNERNIELFETILSGDLLNNDSNMIDPNNVVNEPTCFDNSFHVLIYSDSTLVTRDLNDSSDETQVTSHDSAVLDGFTIKSGNAGGNYLDYDSKSKGGGMYISRTSAGSVEPGNPVISYCMFILNGAYMGGAIYNDHSEPNIINCRFMGNSANYYPDIASIAAGNGGAIYNNRSSPVITNCEFIENLGASGGGIYNSNDSNAVLRKCQFSNNTANLYQGGGLFNYMSNPVLKDCNFYENYAAGEGGAIYNIEYSEPNLTNCIFTKNSALIGGGITNEDSDPNFQNCVFTGNRALSGAGFDNNYGNPVFSNCIFRNNIADNKAGALQNFFGESVFKNCIFSGNVARVFGGAILNIAGNLNMINCTIFGNSAGYQGDAVLNKTFIFTPEGTNHTIIIPGSMDFANSILWNGEDSILNNDGSDITINYSDVQGGTAAIDSPRENLIWGQNNIDVDPCFVKRGFWADINDPNIIVEPNDPNAFWVEGDYHLQSTAGHYDPNSQTWIIDDVNSPCIDAGYPNSSFGDEPQPNGGRINMGAYGGTSQASMSPGEPLIANRTLDEIDGDIRIYNRVLNQ